ncbi:MAG: hypothetical protein ACXVJD_07535 [Mucilaginibacter sp.]
MIVLLAERRSAGEVPIGVGITALLAGSGVPHRHDGRSLIGFDYHL